MQIHGRMPVNTDMTAETLDLLSGGRFLLGLGTSGPQVVEGWHGQPWGKPLGKTREYVEIVRAALGRKVVEHHGEHYRIPWDGPGATGPGKPLKLMLRPLRTEIPIYLAALGPKNVALAAEIADGWLPIFVDPVALVGPKERIAERLEAWRKTPVTTLVLGTVQPEALRTLAELVL